jgi:altronate dehydratase small subunit
VKLKYSGKRRDKMASDALIINEEDNVATALRDIDPEEKVKVSAGTGEKAIVVREPIPFGHKFAIRDIAEGENIIKYGEVMGRATRFIGGGFHAHIQNIESLRGRGDWTAGDQ